MTLFLIDLGEDINGKCNNDQKNFLIAIINYLEKIGRVKCPIALIVTKCKTYGNEAKWKKIFQTRYVSLVEKHWTGDLKLFYTDAVADTITDENNDLIPKKDFTSYGLEEMLSWISQQTNKAVGMKLLKNMILTLAVVLLFTLIVYFIAPIWIILGLIVFMVYRSYQKYIKNKKERA